MHCTNFRDNTSLSRVLPWFLPASPPRRRTLAHHICFELTGASQPSIGDDEGGHLRNGLFEILYLSLLCGSLLLVIKALREKPSTRWSTANERKLQVCDWLKTHAPCNGVRLLMLLQSCITAQLSAGLWLLTSHSRSNSCYFYCYFCFLCLPPHRRKEILNVGAKPCEDVVVMRTLLQ